MSDQIAINIAIIPPEDIQVVAIEINNNQLTDQPWERGLGSSQRIPHITLMQAILYEKDLENAKQIVNELCSKYAPLKLRSSYSKIKDQCYLAVSGSDEIRKLHEEVMRAFEGIVHFDAKTEHHFDPYIKPSSIDWVKYFKQNAAFDNFDPHITIGVGGATKKPQDQDFIASRVTICQLGNYGTCAKVLSEHKLVD